MRVKTFTRCNFLSEIKPWHKQPRETALWFERFKTWLYQDKPRSFVSVYNEERARKGTEKPAQCLTGSWHRAIEKWQWRARAEAWDAAEQIRLDIELAEEQKERRRIEKEKAAKMEAKADDMMELPVTRVVDDDELGMVMMAAPSITFKHAADLYLGASTLARRALGMSEKVEEQRLTNSKGKDIKGAHGIFIFPPIPEEEPDPVPGENQGEAPSRTERGMTIVVAGKARVVLPEIAEESEE